MLQHPDPDVYNGFNFAAGDPLPCVGAPTRAPIGASQSRYFRSFAHDIDARLWQYLQNRNVSPYFLTEIDGFLSLNPELAFHCPEWTSQVNQPDVLRAYLHFTKGYTRPARYHEGVLPSLHDIRLPPRLPRLAEQRDPELDAWFDGTPYRTDLLQLMDQEVDRIASKIWRRGMLTYQERKMISYCVWGNLVDAFKYFEYNYQETWLPHRFLPQHVMLLEIPKPPKYCEPMPRTVIGKYDPCVSVSFRTVRVSMARAHDAGIDVVDVLLDNFTSTLCRKGLKQADIFKLRVEATRMLDDERLHCRGRDIVDMVMGIAANAGVSITGTGRSSRPRPSRKQRQTRSVKRHPMRGQGHDRKLNQLENALRRMSPGEARVDSRMPTPDLEASKLRRQQMQREWVNSAFEIVQKRGLVRSQTVRECRALFTPKAFLNSDGDRQREDNVQELRRLLQM